MKRGVVMSVNKQHAIVMTADGQFLRAPISGKTQIGEELTFDEEYKPARIFKPVYRYSGAAAIVLLLMLPLLLYIGRDAPPVVAYLSMDINPSVEIGVDEEDKVRELHALNEDGEKIIQGLDYKGMKVEVVAASILQRANVSHYLDTPNKEIFITSVILNGQTGLTLDYESILAKKVDEAIRSLLAKLSGEAASANVTTLSVPYEVRDAAAANGISSGKMALYLMAKAEGYMLELEQIQQQSITKVTEPIGGVKAIVEQAEYTSKEKLKELVEKEKQSSWQNGNGDAGKATPEATAATKPVKTEKPEKTAVSNSVKTNNGKGTAKPSVTSKPAAGSKQDDKKDEKEKWKDRFKSDDEDDNDGWKDKIQDDDWLKRWSEWRKWYLSNNNGNDDDRKDDKQSDEDRDDDNNDNSNDNDSDQNKDDGKDDDKKKRDSGDNGNPHSDKSDKGEKNSREKRDD
ncbi:anti-sigma factor domain-containing protein [Paenibacillus sp. N4]|uniref:anti-sigma factor domain-containing protein n=1 Tax=Paenibacillus vietnamensis TaxID=2590547 RepID=UPI001CD15F00|nr:anti-sigma factor domain-containing protein [Paenibacillus vietnamensis]MCA0757478.1 anti-sigma factor domain-containing protein [Paenibacillus vietnamensis]